MITYRGIEIRTVPSATFNGCVLGEERGAVLFTDPSSGQTVIVDYLSGARLKRFRDYHQRVVGASQPLTVGGLRRALGVMSPRRIIGA